VILILFVTVDTRYGGDKLSAAVENRHVYRTEASWFSARQYAENRQLLQEGSTAGSWHRVAPSCKVQDCGREAQTANQLKFVSFVAGLFRLLWKPVIMQLNNA